MRVPPSRISIVTVASTAKETHLVERERVPLCRHSLDSFTDFSSGSLPLPLVCHSRPDAKGC